jgi:hypothetical protein
MTFKPAIWRRIAIVLIAINVAGAGFAAGTAEPWHAAIHATLAVAFGLWAQRLGRRPGGGEIQTDLEALEIEVTKLRQELNEMQERMDFAERLLAQRPEPGRVGPQR